MENKIKDAIIKALKDIGCEVVTELSLLTIMIPIMESLLKLKPYHKAYG